MSPTPTSSALLAQRLSTPPETPADRERRVRASVEVAREMLRNGCSSNTITRYTGLREEELSRLEATVA